MERQQRPKKKRRRKGKSPIPKDVVREIFELNKTDYGTRKIADRVGYSRKRVRNTLKAAGIAPLRNAGSKVSLLTPYEDSIRDGVQKGLSASRILREIQPKGYQGGRTILVDRVRVLKALIAPEKVARKVKCRFETGPGEEMQIDWSPFRVPIGGVLVTIHVLGVILAWSRKLFLGFFRDEKQSTLLAGLVEAFQYFGGVGHRLVVDNMATAVLGRMGSDRKPIWNPRFAQFIKHHGCDGFACAVRDPDRKGKKERAFRYLEEDFIRGSEFTSWEDIQKRAREWLDQTDGVANNRVHGTTGRVPNQAWADEKPFLIPLPMSAFPAYDLETRVVDRTSILSIRGVGYSIPASLAPGVVSVRLYPHRFEVVDRDGKVALSRAYAEKGPGHRRLVVDSTHYALVRRRQTSGQCRGRLQDDFLARYPDLEPLVSGLKQRMKSLAGIHLRELVRLAERFGETAMLEAARRAQSYGRHDAGAVRRILEARFPIASGELEVEPLAGGTGPVLLGEVEPATFDAFDTLDRVPGRDQAGGQDTSSKESYDGA